MPDLDLVIRARRAVVGSDQTSCAIGVREGVVAAVSAYDAELPAAAVVELADDEVLLPGLVDSTSMSTIRAVRRGGLRNGDLAAAAGGVTTIVDMPLNSIRLQWTCLLSW